MRAAGPVGRSNRELSTLRAVEILSYLIHEKKLSAERLSAVGWGSQRPVASNRTQETRKLNRRIEMLFVHEAAPVKPKGVFTFRRFFFNVLD